MSGLPPLKGFKCAYMNKQFVNFKQCIREKFSATSTTFPQSIQISAASGHTAKPFLMSDKIMEEYSSCTHQSRTE